MNSWRSWFLAVVLTVLSSQTGSAFGTISIFGQSGEHEKITLLGLAPFAIEPWTLSEIKGRSRVFGAVGAPDNPFRGLLFDKAAHCDGGDTMKAATYPQDAKTAEKILTECRNWIFRNLRRAVDEAGGLVDAKLRIAPGQNSVQSPCSFSGKPAGHKCNVLEAIGLAFHAAQDFYSHSNWSDKTADGRVDLTNPPGLGHDLPAPWLNPRLNAPFPTGLISGCFDGVPEWIFCRGRVRHVVLNKDTGPINVRSGAIGVGTTERGGYKGNFARAVRVAIADTRDKWRYFEQQITEKYGAKRGQLIICVVRHDDPAACKAPPTTEQ